MKNLESLRLGWNLISENLHRATCCVCIALILFMTLEVLVHVFFRYILDAPLRWGEEVARLAMVWAGLLGIGIALKEGEHIGIEMFTRRLSRRSIAWCSLISHVLIGVFLLVLLYFGIQIAREAWATFLPALWISWTWSMAAVPVSAGIQLVHLISMLLSDIHLIMRN
jgi:TRAP-type C4-dicarboxylate transport system permease small subunit